jgi:hypothetical protein
MSNIIQGVQSAIPQPSTYGYTPGRGYHQRLRWKITNPADIPALLGQLIAAGYAYDVSPEADGAITVVEATSQPAQDTNGDPASTPLAEIWERDSMTTEKDLLQCDLNSFAQILPYRKLLIQKAIDDKTALDSSVTDPAELDLYALLAHGVKSVRVSSPVVRRTRITASSYTVKASDTNMGKILTTAQMTSLENAPSTVLFNLPSSGSVNASGVTAQSGWYKKPAKVAQQGDGRWQIVQEYEYDIWATRLYASA